jgi:peroxiredoxin
MASESLADLLEEGFRHCRDMDAPLSARLEAFADIVRTLNPTFADTVDRLVLRLQRHGAGAEAPRVGEQMPPFLLPDDRGHLVTLDEFVSKGPVAITFHRGHWCPYCRINTYALAGIQQEIAADGGQIVAIMPDRQRFVEELKSEANADFPILTDLDNGYALSLNLAIWVGQEMAEMIKSAGWDIPSYQGNESWTLPIPATFVVGQDSRVKARFVDPDYRKRMTIEDLCDALRGARRLP